MEYDAIGGYFGLDVSPVTNWRPDGIGLNSARNALAVLLRARQPSCVYVPSYCCSAIVDAIPNNVEIRWYNVDEKFEIVDVPDISPETPVIYVNYFGLKDEYSATLVAGNPEGVILDNSQAYYSQPVPSADCIYSPRKFLPVPDGGILACDALIELPQKRARSLDRARHLLGRAETRAEAYFEDYQRAEAEIACEPAMRISALTDQLLDHLDTNRFAVKRCENFHALDTQLGFCNRIKLPLTDTSVPMVYPFWPSRKGLRQMLIENRVYVASYWPEVLENTEASTLETEITCDMVPLPIDQRYNLSDMKRVAELCLAYLDIDTPRASQ
ncbi:hypothetical protein KPG71_09270 [Roseovarius sp. PS-C2]|uniref:hypothetical protein n=1 Tax=Roseovarius sp. PS-C2 TaxID=2820814 RepID=UPI001C0E3ACC|nr:hypothetical protein [Roseovarius sp. PS-C2]MBU3260200.1 hypothetical protein [Roseovarius sp. PS-C2]